MNSFDDVPHTGLSLKLGSLPETVRHNILQCALPDYPPQIDEKETVEKRSEAWC